MPHHAKAAMWTEGHSRRWFARCDQCNKWRLVADYYEVYPPLHGPNEERGWWWACSSCMVDIINERFDAALQQMEDALDQLEENSERPSDEELAPGLVAYREGRMRPWREVKEELGIEDQSCERVFAGYGVAGIGYKCATHGGIWPVCEDGTKCPALTQLEVEDA